jgi:D-alanine-D-alanine ligase
MKKNIAIIMGGFSSEYPISLKSGKVVYSFLDPEKFNRYRILIARDRWVYVDENEEEYPVNRHDFTVKIGKTILSFDCVFNAIHGSPGEDGYLQAYFSLLNIPQTSCDHYQAALTFNKRDLLSVLKPYGIKAAASFYLNRGDTIDEDAIVKKVGLPCFVKANKSGSSFGVTKVYRREELSEAIEKAYKEDDEILIETFLDGTEVSVGVITYEGKTLVLPITEIVSENDFFDFQAKYEGKAREITPARLSDKQVQKVSRAASLAYEAIRMRGYSRSEFIFIGDEPYLLEMNTTPGLTEESILPQQAKAAGISLSSLFESVIFQALEGI